MTQRRFLLVALGTLVLAISAHSAFAWQGEENIGKKLGDGQSSDAEREKARAAVERAGGADREGLLRRFDTDGDGQISEAERNAARESMSKALKARGAPGQNAGFPNREEILKVFDANGNGKLDPPELLRARAAQARSAGGGERPMRPSPQPGAELTRRFDANGNGTLDPEERDKMRAALAEQLGDKPADADKEKSSRINRQELLDRFDENGNGKLDPDERKKATTTLRRERAVAKQKAKSDSADPDGDAADDTHKTDAAKDSKTENDRKHKEPDMGETPTPDSHDSGS